MSTSISSQPSLPTLIERATMIECVEHAKATIASMRDTRNSLGTLKDVSAPWHTSICQAINSFLQAAEKAGTLGSTTSAATTRSNPTKGRKGSKKGSKKGPKEMITLEDWNSRHDAIFTGAKNWTDSLKEPKHNTTSQGKELIAMMPSCQCQVLKKATQDESIDYNRFLVATFKDCPKTLSSLFTMASNMVEKYQRIAIEGEFASESRKSKVLSDIHDNQFANNLKAKEGFILQELESQLITKMKAESVDDEGFTKVSTKTEPVSEVRLKERYDSFPHSVFGHSKDSIPRWGEYLKWTASRASDPNLPKSETDIGTLSLGDGSKLELKAGSSSKQEGKAKITKNFVVKDSWDADSDEEKGGEETDQE